MLSIPLPWPLAGLTLLLTPRWGEFGAPAQIALLSLAAIVPFVLIFLLYLYEVKIAPIFRSLLLLYLRLTALAVLLFLVLLQPKFAQTHTFDEPGRVLVAVDRSASIDMPDPQRKPIDKLRLARALGLNHSPDVLCDDQQIKQWIGDYEKKGSPQWVRDDETAGDPAKRMQLQQTRQAQHDRLCQLVDQATRTQIADAVLSDDGLRRLYSALNLTPPTGAKTGQGPNLLAGLRSREEVELIGFDSALRKAAADHPEMLFGPAPSAAAAHATDLNVPLARGLETAGVGQGKLLGVIVLTDGRHNAGDSPLKKAEELGDKKKIPIYPVALGCDEAPAQTVLTAMTAPNSVYRDAEAAVDLKIRVAGLPKQEVEVELFLGTGPDKKQIDKQTIEHDGASREYKVTFHRKLEELGPQTLTAMVHPKDPTVKVLDPASETRSIVVQVNGDHARVLLVDGEARWEFHYLQSAFQRDKTIETESVVFNQPRLNTALTDDALESIGSPREHLPEGPDALSKFDCIVLGDVSPDQLPPEDRKRLERFVGDRGGTLVIVAGKRCMPTAYPDVGPDAAEADPIRKMLPIKNPRVFAPVDGFKPALTADGRDTKFMDLEDDAGKNLVRWDALPPHYWAVVGEAKPAAATLAYAPDGPPDPNDATAQERRDALIVRQSYGLGRVLYVGLDSTWRWRKGVGDQYHHRFWGQVARWAADRPLQTGNRYLRFGSSEPLYRSGQDAEVTVRFNDVKDAEKAAPGAQAEVLRRGGDGAAVAVVEMKRKPAQPDALEAKVPNLPDGDYEVRLKMD
ncbi:MAG TPA: hypothetical protein VMS17_04930, partial [Gemmataceae bacterium]|nr:hypothetical protein [Gemmataceae bacterium]